MSWQWQSSNIRRPLVDAVERAATEVGYVAPEDAPAYLRAVIDMVSIAVELAKFPGAYDFGAADLSDRLSQRVLGLHTEQNYSRLPPPDMLYIHRKLGGLYLLLKRLSLRPSSMASHPQRQAMMS